MGSFHDVAGENSKCPCGCEKQARLLSGKYVYSENQYIVFHSFLLKCVTSGPNVWSMIGSGPWFENEEQNCWVTLHTWLENENLVTRVEDSKASPLSLFVETDGRLLTRSEVLSQEGWKEWVFEINDRLQVDHDEISTFILSVTSA